jgi:hypothetical protein
VRPVRKSDNLTASCEPIVWIMWDPQLLTTLQASKACYGNSFTFFLLCWHKKNILYRSYVMIGVNVTFSIAVSKNKFYSGRGGSKCLNMWKTLV